MTERAEEIVRQMTPHERTMFHCLYSNTAKEFVANTRQELIIIHIPNLKNLGLYNLAVSDYNERKWRITISKLGLEVREVIALMAQVTQRLENS